MLRKERALIDFSCSGVKDFISAREAAGAGAEAGRRWQEQGQGQEQGAVKTWLLLLPHTARCLCHLSLLLSLPLRPASAPAYRPLNRFANTAKVRGARASWPGPCSPPRKVSQSCRISAGVSRSLSRGN